MSPLNVEQPVSASIFQNRFRATLQRNRLVGGREAVSTLQANIGAKI